MPHTAAGNPITVTAQKLPGVNGTPLLDVVAGSLPSDVRYSRLTTMLEAVPIMVHAPPRIAAKLSGMNSFEGLIRSLRAQSLTMGRYIATIGVLFINALITATGVINRS